MVWREVEPTTPPRVTYGLTPLGSGPCGHLAGLLDWIEDNADRPHDGQQLVDAAQ